MFALLCLLFAHTRCFAENQRAQASLARPERPRHDASGDDAKLEATRRRTEEMRRSASIQERSIAADMLQHASIRNTLPSEAQVTADYRNSMQRMDQALKGIDILIMMDCTGSRLRLS